ncbi:bifunctional hydroxymethylpyrimidine kinase/phosphomethylpyrimidine kinase [Salsuginibacillus kocurii]|uniref:bifunctional hydroxymethylpyrimidine kinase/phosphomethylpyrimidine kinase n=1 Tax=Salsuginibacillus kocurii TaxID=427078 RepID=UPI000375C93A|nr:bifunctional hydroxymethylpyrimidine kinase/phosphomethylpyrimidine kinase [Salsuginibacillus kocurii]
MAIKKALTIAGSDSGGGAGIQADLKTFQEREVFGMSVITALTAQNTQGVHGVFPQTTNCVEAQLQAVLDDLRPEAIKTGMLFSAELIELIASYFHRYELEHVVVDPVMIAKGGSELLQSEAVEALKQKLLPHAYMLTPNVPEASKLLEGAEIRDKKDMKEAAFALRELGPEHIVLKGGHLEGEESTDMWCDGETVKEFRVGRVETTHTHGTGCTFAACLAAELAKGNTTEEAVATAKAYITKAIVHSLNIGTGIGPTDHAAYRLYQD